MNVLPILELYTFLKTFPITLQYSSKSKYQKLTSKPDDCIKLNPWWKKATDEQKYKYMQEVDERLTKLNVRISVIQCHDVHGNDTKQMRELDYLMLETLEAVEESASLRLHPKPSVRKTIALKEKIHNWGNAIEPFKHNANFWQCQTVGL